MLTIPRQNVAHYCDQYAIHLRFEIRDHYIVEELFTLMRPYATNTWSDYRCLTLGIFRHFQYSRNKIVDVLVQIVIYSIRQKVFESTI